MRKLRVSKKNFLIVLVLLIAGLFVYFFWFSEKEISEEIKEPEEISAEIKKSVSSDYRYDFKNR